MREKIYINQHKRKCIYIYNIHIYMVYILTYLITLREPSELSARVTHGNRGSHCVTHGQNFLLQFQLHFDK